MMRNILLSAILIITIPQLFAQTLQGIDNLFTPKYLQQLEGKRIGVLAHFASRNQYGQHLVDLLHLNEKTNIVKIFAPEHGFRTLADDWIGDTTDENTGLPVYSLYRQDRRAPTQEQLADIDIIIIDLKDVGMRFYTYSITMAKTMVACKTAGVKVVILDRPNPISGTTVAGAILEEHLRGWLSSYYPMPTIHGMTMGELALYYNRFFEIDSSLIIVPMSNWNREMIWDDTRIDWIPPSPALPEALQSYHYATLGALESLNIAVGRGITNEKAFKYFGAPWITTSESKKLTNRLNNLQLPGVSFSPISWQVTRSDYNGETARGFEIKISNFSDVQPYRTLIDVMKVMKSQFAGRLTLTKTTEKFLGASWIRTAIENNRSTNYILNRIQGSPGFQEFLMNREEVLLY